MNEVTMGRNEELNEEDDMLILLAARRRQGK